MNDAQTFDLPTSAGRQDRPSRRSTVLWLAVILAEALAIFVLAFLTVLSVDDFIYATFWDGGFSAFLHNMARHYEVMNGRTFVHVIVTVVLRGGTVLFGLVSVGLAAAFPLLGRKLIAPDAPPLPVLAAFMGGLLLTPLPMMVQGILWQSAYFNYVFPTFLLLLFLWLLRRAVYAERLKPAAAVGLAVYAFLCGATTEQSGLLAVCVTLAVAAECLVANRRRVLVPLACLLTAVGGVVSIFLSPATRERLFKEQSGPFLQTLRRGLMEQAELFSGYFAVLALLALLFFLFGLRFWRQSGKKAVSAVLFLVPLPALAGLAFCREAAVLLPCFTVLLAVLLAEGLFWWLKGDRALGVLLALAVGSVLVIASTQSSGPRTLAPFYLYILTVLACLLAELCAGKEKRLACVGIAVLAAAGLAYAGSDLPGYVYNYRVDQRNQAAVREARTTHELWYDMGYDMEYTHIKPSDNFLAREYFLRLSRLDEDSCRLYFFAKGRPAVFVNGQRMEFPGIYLDGTLFIPMRQTVEGLGGTVDWTEEKTVISLDGVEYGYTALGDALCLTWNDADGTPHVLETRCYNPNYTMFFSEELLRDLFSVRVTQSGEEIVVSR